MSKSRYVFFQLITFPDRNYFNDLIHKYQGDK